nr:MAG TPA: hypothetical protein [Caudoviricetes sp.]
MSHIFRNSLKINNNCAPDRTIHSYFYWSL